MAGTNLNQMLAFVQDAIQVQQNALIQNSTKVKNAEKSDFDQFLQVSTANVNSRKETNMPTTNVAQKETAVEQKKETTDVPVETTETKALEKTETAEAGNSRNVEAKGDSKTTDALKSMDKENVDDIAKKITIGITNAFQSKVEQTVMENIQHVGAVEEETNQLEENLLLKENVTDMPDVVEGTNNIENSEIIVDTTVGEDMLVAPETEGGMLQQEQSSEEEQAQILQLGNIQIRFKFTTKEDVSITIPDVVSTEEITEMLPNGFVDVELPEDLKEVLENIQTQLLQQIVENFQVTEEEVTEAMEALAIQFFDLMNSDKLKELAVCLSNEENLVSMVTNEQLFTAYKEAEAGIEKVMTALPENLTEALKDLSKSVDELQVKLSQVQIPEEMVILEQPEIMPEAMEKMDVLTDTLKMEGEVPKQNHENVIPIEVEVADEVVKEQPKQEVSGEQKVVNVEDGDAVAETKVLQQEQNSSSQGENQWSSQKETEAGTTAKVKTDGDAPVAVQSSTNYSTVVTETEVQTVVTTQHTDFDGIVRQIVEQVKVQVKPDTVSMELQLNPENLGKVSLHISSKEGAVTAQLLVQNETVKAAIEGQLTILRETMQQQGIKVDAVEVAVQTGDFGRSLEQQSQQGKQKENNQQSKVFRNRGINLLSGIDEENMDEEELLRAHIMRESGNSVDMNA